MTERPKDPERSDRPAQAGLFGEGAGTHEAVPPGCECPSCKEWRMDLLIWSGDELVACRSCGTIYDPRDGTIHAGGKSNGGPRDASDV